MEGLSWAEIVDDDLSYHNPFSDPDFDSDKQLTSDDEEETAISTDCDGAEAGDPVGIREVQSILMSATQTNLSHFHTAGMGTASTGMERPSAVDAMDSVYTPRNTSMTFLSSANIMDIRKCIVGANLRSFVITIGSSFTLLPERENVWYEVLDVRMPDNILRFYIDYKRMRDHGLTLEMLAQEALGSDCEWRVSPDFMGMIDIPVTDMHMSSWLSRMECNVCGTPTVLSCDIVGPRVVTRGTNMLAVSRVPNVDKRTIVSNNVTEVERALGIEAAAGELSKLVGITVSDFMTRTGTVLPFNKRSKEVQAKGLLTSMGFERPKDDIINALLDDRGTSRPQVYESIMAGIDPFPGFTVVQHNCR